MSKTIPIWAAVLNKVAAGLHEQDKIYRSRKWDTELHLPIWLSESEKSQIEDRLDGWAASMQTLGGDILNSARKLNKPMQPIWLCPTSILPDREEPSLTELSFFPLILVSTSKQIAGARRTAGQQGQCGWPYVYVPGVDVDG